MLILLFIYLNDNVDTCSLFSQLVDGHTLFDYSVGLNDLIQLMVRPPAVASEETDTGAKTEEESDKENDAVRHIL